VGTPCTNTVTSRATDLGVLEFPTTSTHFHPEVSLASGTMKIPGVCGVHQEDISAGQDRRQDQSQNRGAGVQEGRTSTTVTVLWGTADIFLPVMLTLTAGLTDHSGLSTSSSVSARKVILVMVSSAWTRMELLEKIQRRLLL